MVTLEPVCNDSGRLMVTDWSPLFNSMGKTTEGPVDRSQWIFSWLICPLGCKRQKSQEAKQRSTEERKPMHKMERALDMDLFLEAQEQWAKDSPHHLIIFHEMFLHAKSEGWKEAEQIVCRGHQ